MGFHVGTEAGKGEVESVCVEVDADAGESLARCQLFFDANTSTEDDSFACEFLAEIIGTQGEYPCAALVFDTESQLEPTRLSLCVGDEHGFGLVGVVDFLFDFGRARTHRGKAEADMPGFAFEKLLPVQA